MIYRLALALHILSAVVWVGGMFFAYALVRPVLGTLEERESLILWKQILKKFFPWVWLTIILLLATGFFMIFAQGGFSSVNAGIWAMMVIGVVMMVMFKFIYVAPFQHLCRGVEQEKWEVASYAIGTIRNLLAVNLVLGFLVILLAATLV